MKTATLLSLAALTALAPGIAGAAGAIELGPVNRVVVAEHQFGDVRFVVGSRNTGKFLEMTVDGNFIGSFPDFIVTDVIPSPDGRHFLAVSNDLKSSMAFAILDRRGVIVASGPHGGNLRYCNRSAWGQGEWIDPKNARATFSTEKNRLTTPATEYLFVTVRGCRGDTVVLARPQPPEPRVAEPANDLTLRTALLQLQQDLGVATGTDDVVVTGTRIDAPVETFNRSSFFIGNTIANLRGLDPTFGGRTLTLVDGRRTAGGAAGPVRPMNLPPTWAAAAVFERGSCHRDNATCDLLVSQPDGTTQAFATGMMGEFIALPLSSRIFACSWNVSALEQNSPAFIALDGSRTTLPAHPGPVRLCARAGSGEEVLLVYGLAEAGRSFTLARVFNANGMLLAEKTYTAPGELTFSVAGKAYTALVPGP